MYNLAMCDYTEKIVCFFDITYVYQFLHISQINAQAQAHAHTQAHQIEP